ncbi:MAG: DNA translocase FtsK, partial [Bacteroidales bacterium]|nr:DNA translocase FtsK [Bacteroidales bacterium]
LKTIGVKRINTKKILFHSILISIIGSVTLGFIFFRFSDSTYLLAGGMHGYFVTKWLIAYIGSIGTFLLLSFTILLYVCAFVDGALEKVVTFISRIFNKEFKIPEAFKTVSLTDGDEYENNRYEQKPEPSVATSNIRNENSTEQQQHNFSPSTSYNSNDNKETFSSPEKTRTAQASSSDNGFTVTVAEGDDDPIESPMVISKGAEIQQTDSHRGSIDTPYDPTLDLSNYQMPPFDLLIDYKNNNNNEEEERQELNEKKDKIIETLNNFNIKVQSIKATIGPTVTLYELVPAPGVKISKIQGLQEDIAMALAALSIRVIAPMPGRGTVGIEVPNSNPQIVSMLSMVKSKKFQESTYEIPIVMGKTISNEVFIFDLTKTPHLLVAGATGMGKSVGLNAIITSILYKKHPSQVKLVMIDPKQVEFSIYRRLEKHFMAKMESTDNVIITETEKVKDTLTSLTQEMEDRYTLLTKANCREIKEYTKKFIAQQLNPQEGHRFMPYIVVIIDEFADLIMTAGKEIETPIARIAQKARAVGIHLIIATQRPSTNIITGIIKANFPARIAFKVTQRIDSMTILDATGADKLMGKGDMLISLGNTTRVQCALVDTEEVVKITEFIGNQQGYACAYPLPEINTGDGEEIGHIESGELDSLFADVARMVVETQTDQNTFSTSNIQRRFSLGYNRAGKLMDQLERAGIVAPQNGSKPRQVLVHDIDELERILRGFGV